MFSWAMVATILGVIASKAFTLSSFIMFWMTLFSSESITPSLTPMFDIAEISSLLTVLSSSFGVSHLLMALIIMTRGYISIISMDMVLAAKPIRCFQ